MTPVEVREKLQAVSAEVTELIRAGATKDMLRNGANGKRGINHLIELFMMLPDTGQSAEFRIKE